jgi:uncharacterized protein
VIDIITEFKDTLDERLSQGSIFIQIVTGPRQVGKTTLVKEIVEKWGDAAIYSSADLPSPPGSEWISENWNKARIKLKNSPDKKALLVLDEVQKVERWSEVVKLYYDEDRHSGLQVVLLGSSSLAIHSGLGESLLGRFEIMRLPHWGFRECSLRFNWSFEQFIQFGGYPAPASIIHDIERWQNFMRDSVIEAVISRDISLLKEIAKPALFRQSLELAMKYPASVISYDKFIGQLQDKGNSTTVKSYLETLSHAFLIRLIEKYSSRPVSKKASSPKIIPLCPALISTFNSPVKVIKDSDWYGRVFESVIGAYLSFYFRDTIYYWREKSNEVDFVLENDNELYIIEVKSGLKKSIRGLEAFIKSFKNTDKNITPVIITKELASELLFLNTRTEILTFLRNFSVRF